MGNNNPVASPPATSHPAIQFPCPNCGTGVSVPIPLGSIVNHAEFTVAVWKINKVSRCPRCLAGYRPMLQIVQQAGWGAVAAPDEPGKIIIAPAGIRTNKPS